MGKIAPYVLYGAVKTVPGLSDVVLKGGKIYVISSKRIKRLKGLKIGGRELTEEDFRKAGEEIARSVAEARGLNFDDLTDLDGGYAFTIKEKDGVKEYRFRVNAGRYDDGKNLLVTLRWLKEHRWTVKDYFLTPLSVNPVFKRLRSNLGGLYLVIGPTGSGKSTVTAALIKEILKGPYNVITLEDPIEYRLYPDVGEITQREVGIDTPTFARGLKSAMRQNPNVIFVGEVRDEETVEALAQAADTGHVVIATLHTESPKDTLERLQGLISAGKRESVMRVIGKTLIGVLGIRMFDPPEGKGKIILHEYLNAEAPNIRSLLLKGEFSQIVTYQNSLKLGCISFAVSAAYQLEFFKNFTEKDFLSTGLFDREELRDALMQVRQNKKLLMGE